MPLPRRRRELVSGDRLRAPELRGRAWLGTGGQPLSLEQLRGKVVLLDFWTFCCINCLHVLDELRGLEERFADALVIIGVHSPKFAHERNPAALRAAVARHQITHPVLDDPDLETWREYGARAWPTLVVIDPDGFIVAHCAGEGHGPALAALIERLVTEHAAKGTLRPGAPPFVRGAAPDGVLSFPSKAIALDNGHFLVADAGHHTLTEVTEPGDLVRRIGAGDRGLRDGDAAGALFAEPTGLALLGPRTAEGVGYDVLVADAANHALRGVNLATGQVTTVAGTGTQLADPGAAPLFVPAAQDAPGVAATHIDLSSPWDVIWDAERQLALVAMAGSHQIWAFDPIARRIGLIAGTGAEGLLDGPALRAHLAQPSGLALDGEGTCWIADSEVSALRMLTPDGWIKTAIGQGLFEFGLVDGDRDQARAQHPLGVAVVDDQTIALADTYNGAVRLYNKVTGILTTVAEGLNEPSGFVVLPSEQGQRLFVVESGAHRIVPLSLNGCRAARAGEALSTKRPPTDVLAGRVALRVPFSPGPGRVFDDAGGEAVYLQVSATPSDLLVTGAGPGNELARDLELRPGSGTLHVSVRVATCDKDAEFPACHLTAQDWGVPVRVHEGQPGQSTRKQELVLPLASLDEGA
jgi:thiol-disulfide isomerase/thioredoxin